MHKKQKKKNAKKKTVQNECDTSNDKPVQKLKLKKSKKPVDVVPSMVDESFACPCCSKKFAQLNRLKQHKKDAHSLLDPAESCQDKKPARPLLDPMSFLLCLRIWTMNLLSCYKSVFYTLNRNRSSLVFIPLIKLINKNRFQKSYYFFNDL